MMRRSSLKRYDLPSVRAPMAAKPSLRHLALLTLSLIMAAGSAAAKPTEPMPARQDLGAGLIDLGIANHVQIVFQPHLVKGLTCKHDKVGGLDDRLKSLLTPYGLSYRRVASDVIVVYKPPSQPAAVTPPPEPDLPPIIVRSYRQSLVRAGDVKRRADYTVDVIDAEDIAKYPARNVAEALQLVTGVSLERQRGIGLYVSVRGMGPQFQNVELDGHTLAATELIENAGVRGRDFRFDILPAELVSRVDVVKTPTPDMEEGAMGGDINMHTLRPFDVVPQGQTFRGLTSLRISHNDRARDASPALQLMSAWTTPDRHFGLLVSLITDRQRVRNDRFYSYGWNQDQFTSVLGPGIYTPTRTRPTIEIEDRRHSTLFGSVQWRPDEHNETEVSFLATRLDVAYDEMGLDIYPDDQSLATPTFVPGTATIVDNTAIKGRIDTVRFMASRETSLNRFDLLLGHIKHHWRSGSWSANISADLSRAHSYHPPGRGTARSRVAFFAPLTYDFSGGGRTVPSLLTPIDYTDPKVYVGQRFDYATKDALDSDEALSYDLSRSFDGALSRLQFGQQYHHHNREYTRRDWKLYDLVGLGIDALGADSFDAGLSPTFLKNIPGDTPRNWVVPSATAFFDRLMTPDVMAQAPTATDATGSFSVDERIWAGFVRSDWRFQLWGKPVTGNIGARHVDTLQMSEGAALVGDQALPVRYRFHYSATLPSTNLRMVLRPGVIMRLSAARVMSRPNIIDSAPRLTISNDAATGQGGNPYLRPFLATDVSTGLELYPSPSSALTVAVFGRRFDAYITRENTHISIPGHGDILLSTTVNGGRASVVGIEGAYNRTFDRLPKPWNHLGVQATFTLLDVKADYASGTLRIHDALTGMSRSTYNLVGFYEDDRLMIRLGYYWRDRYLSSVGSSIQAPSYTDSFGSLDGSASLEIDARTTINVEAVNLLNTTRYAFAMTKDRPQEIHQYGRTLSVQLRKTF
ncbi:TonB-dependent receptor [Asticcacaulis sp. 201]|uniref:TonB-dependent receptor n=1 Tax=Asticcacaulis sp. 201 TaxID=3028787 RepID=UPI002916204B|nr:TonB-dependent receptor [Asticcacaulis sp. 201]MDV6331182.1 TonB-dependent receptor [Asticcacaulis sp. 201]